MVRFFNPEHLEDNEQFQNNGSSPEEPESAKHTWARASHPEEPEDTNHWYPMDAQGRTERQRTGG